MILTLEQAKEIMVSNDGNLYLSSCTGLTQLPDGLTVGGWLDLRGTQITGRQKVKRLMDGEYVLGRYLYCDGILTHIKKTRSIDGFTLYIGKIKGRNVVSDGTYYAHCDKFRDGIADILFKRAKDRGAEQYKNVTMDTEMKVPELVMMYRILTDTCRQGSENFVKSLGSELKDSYTVREAIELTKGQYGAEQFAHYFEGKEP